MSKIWVVYAELYEDVKYTDLSGVYIEGTYPGTETGRLAARRFVFDKIAHHQTLIGGSLSQHGGDSPSSREIRVWISNPPNPALSGLFPVYVCKLVTHTNVRKTRAGGLSNG